MPMYTYRCKKCQHKLDVLRSFDDYAVPPSSDEMEQAGAAFFCTPASEGSEEPEEPEGAQGFHEMERIIASAPSVIRAPGFGSKGNW